MIIKSTTNTTLSTLFSYNGAFSLHLSLLTQVVSLIDHQDIVYLSTAPRDTSYSGASEVFALVHLSILQQTSICEVQHQSKPPSDHSPLL